VKESSGAIKIGNLVLKFASTKIAHLLSRRWEIWSSLSSIRKIVYVLDKRAVTNRKAIRSLFELSVIH